ncbi:MULTISPECIES: NUDIX domain-containing protein [Brevibacillus]|uniref:NUDIX domain-containing protein n=1 Tax=Brevibacillus TaxID=55080 RepID=UPI000402FB0B|nr:MULTISPECIES: NUDIX domain-containing protein [Brevibacillus]QHZ56825.1 NUDIX domain-containing protein [Brevibacillus sp. NSP2.1]
MNNYISTMRKLIGHETLLTVSCGAILEDDQGRILLQQKYNRIWGIPGGLLEIGETFAETIHREVLEETNLIVKAMQLFGIYSGKNGFAQYANGDKVFSVQLIFHVTDYTGTGHLNEESTGQPESSSGSVHSGLGKRRNNDNCQIKSRSRLACRRS